MEKEIANAGVRNLDLCDPELQGDPYSLYGELRDRHPILWMPSLDAYVVSRYDDVKRMLDSSDFMMNKYAPRFTFLDEEFREKYRFIIQSVAMLFGEGPEHVKIRRQLIGPLSNRVLNRHRKSMWEQIAISLEELEGREFDFVRDFCHQVPPLILAGLAGLPRAEIGTFIRCSDAIGRYNSTPVPQSPQALAAQDAIHEMIECISPVVAAQTTGQSGFVEILTAFFIKQGAGKSEAVVKTVFTIVFLLFAGHESTRNLLSSLVYLALRHGGGNLGWVKNATHIDGLIEETLRLESPFQMSLRLAKRDIHIYDVLVREHEKIVLLIGSANRDERQFEHPDKLNIFRPHHHHLGFGKGPHICIGASLARMEAKTMFQVLQSRYPRAGRVGGEVVWGRDVLTRGIESMTFHLTAGA